MQFSHPVRACLYVLILFGVLAATVVSGADWKILPGHVPAGLSRLQAIGRVAGTNQMRLAIGVPLRDPAGLDAFLAQLYDPASPNYRQYLTPEEFTARFGPTESDYESVKDFARTNGLRVVQTHRNRLVLDVAGPAAAVEKAFHLRLQIYQHPTEARRFFAPETEPTMAGDLPVADVQGLSDFSRPCPKFKKAQAAKIMARDGSAPDGSGAYFGNDFRNAYAPGTTLTGAGQMVGLLEFDGYYASDISAYAAAAGGGRSSIVIQPVLLDGFNGVPTTGQDSGDPEVSLDIELAMAMAPGLSEIMVFEGGPNGLQNDVLNSMAAESTVKNLSTSWGWNGGPTTTTDNIFKQMASQGQSFFNASGDTDAFTAGANSVNGVDNPSLVNAPSSSPYITQVGGTTLSMNGAGASFGSETVWNWGGGTGSSGGVSSYYTIPSWQAGISMTANQGSTTMRNIPDVAAVADSVFVYDNRGSPDEIGGTSCGAPLWAGLMALVNQQATALGHSPAGFINPAIYAIGKGQNSGYSYAACFHDTTTGNNFWSSSPSAYSAVAGYDLCTGWGTPNGTGLIDALAGSPGSLAISPSAGVAFSGLVGGPFNPASVTFEVTNASATAAGWSLIGSSAWLKASATNGTLAGFSSVAVTVSLTASANSLKIGTYSAYIAFGNPATHVVQKIPVTLQVNQPLSLSTAQGFTAVGPLGGPFNPSSQTFTLVNAGATAVSWKLVKTASWLNVSASAGSVPAGGQSDLTVSLSASAAKLKASVYSGKITFSDSIGTIAAPTFALSVGQPLVQNGGFETGSFTDWTQSGDSSYSSVVGSNPDYVHSGKYGARLGPPDSGYLSQTIPTVSGQTYALSFWLRNAGGATPNWFQVQWNGSTVFEQQNLRATGWTNVQFFVSAIGDSSSLQFGFWDVPSYLGLDDVSLKAVASSAVKMAVRKADDFQLLWDADANAHYQAQYKTNLCQASWINMGAPFRAAGDSATLTDTNAFQSSRFYRLLELK